MDKDLISLYRSLGYNGPLPDTLPSQFTALEDATPDQIDELPPLDLKGVEELERMYEKDPKKMLKKMDSLNESQMTPEYFGALIEQARNALTHPKEFLKQMDAGIQFESLSASAPLSWPTKYPSYDDITVEPHSHKYEPRADLLGWIINSGSYFIGEKIGLCSKKVFRLHDEHSTSDFVYKMKDPQGNPFEFGRSVRIGLFADFGTGEYHSRFIARNLETKFDLDYAIHLGDVYYAGRTSEFEKHMWEPLKNLMSKTRMFWMAGNHEKYSCYKPYYKFMDDKKGVGPEGLQEQEGSYFCIRSDRYQVVAIDTAFFKDGRYQKKGRKEVEKLWNWLNDRLQEGKDHSPPLINILLSPNEPYNLGSRKRKGLLNDLSELVNKNLIDLWFWGNTHHAALYDKTSETPFIGSCIGHAGHPIYNKRIKNDAKKKGLAPTSWVDTTFKFPPKDFGRLRQDLNNHGFCIMELHKDKIILEYYDWLMRKHNIANFPLDIFA